MLRFFTIFLFLTSYQSTYAYTFNTLNKAKAYKLAEKHNLQGKDTEVTRERKTISLYRLYIKDVKSIRHLRFNRTKRRILKKELYFHVYSSIKESEYKRKYVKLRKQGIPSAAIYRIVSKKKFTLYSVQINEAADDEYDIEQSLNLAQSRLRFEPYFSDADQFGSYLEVVTGIENTSDTENYKLTARLENYSETSRVGEYDLTKVELDEAYLNFTYSESSLTLGKQLFSWGVFDEFSVVDRVNIKNVPRVMFDTGENYRRPLTAVRYEEYFDSFKLDIFIDSGTEEGKFFDSNNLWTGIDQKEGRMRGVSEDDIPAGIVQNLSVSSEGRNSISQGVRLTHNSTFDAGISYLKAHTDLPVITVSSELRKEILANLVTPAGLAAGVSLEYLQEDILAIDFSKQLGDSLYKFEYSYIPNSPLLLKDLSLIKEKRQRFAVGADVDFEAASSSINWQYIFDKYITDKEALAESSFSQFIIHTESLFLQDKISTGIDALYMISDSSFNIRPYFDYNLTDNDILGIKYYLFAGASDSFFGYHTKDNLFVIQYKKSF